MSAEIQPNTPLANALSMAIHPKLNELGWISGAEEAQAVAMVEYIMLMLINGKTQSQMEEELFGEILSLKAGDTSARDFSKWLFEQIDILKAQQNGAPAPAPEGDSLETQDDTSMLGDADTEMNVAQSAAELNAPTGPKSMRTGNFRGGREKRMLGQINRSLDRGHDTVLHRVRGQNGNERISRTPPSGPRMGVGRQPRVPNNRAATIAHGMATGMGGLPPGPGPMNGMNNNWMMPGNQPPMDIYSMLEQQQRMIQQMLMQQQQGGMGRGGQSQNHGKSLFERAQRPPSHFRRGGGPHQHNGNHAGQQSGTGAGASAGSEDIEMSQAKRESLNPEETVCKYNLKCTNKDCKFAHQSPAAPPGITVDVSDVCSFGVACKNRKCVGRHPSLATKAAHQNEQDCKFFPNCQNPHCPFRHPSMPPCRNGGECKVPNCKFTHVKTACKFQPCTNRYCPFTHTEGQRGTFQDKVWVSDEAKEHVSERKFVDDGEPEDLVLPGVGSDPIGDQSGVPDVIS